MASEAKKIAPHEDMEHPANRSERTSVRRYAGAHAADVQDISETVLTPAEHSAVGDLMAELDHVKAELAAAQRRMTQLETKIHEDALLPILNRRGFDRELERTLAYVKRHGTDVSLIYIDLDDFKSINDIHGHATGDAALIHVADILLANLRRSDVVARLGGDEFAILLHRADEVAATLKSDQLADTLASTSLVHDGKEIPLSLTAGVTQLRGEDTIAGAMERADRIMYAAKAHRKRD